MWAIITRTREKIKSHLGTYFEEIGVSVVIVLVAISSYFLGKSAAAFEVEHPAITILDKDDTLIPGASTSTSVSKTTEQTANQTAGVDATLHGKRYYLPWCPTVAKLAPSAKRHFASVAAALAAGLTPAKNCAGMK